MKGNLFTYLLFLIVILSGFYAIHFFEVSQEEARPGTTDLTLETDLHLNNAKLYIKEKSIERSLSHLQKAIHSIEVIEEIADSVSLAELDYALWDLKKVKADVEVGIIEYDHLNHSFILALNSIAAAQLRLSEQYLLDGNERDSGYALRYASEHLHNALKYAADGEIHDELKAYRHIDSLVHTKLDSSQIQEIESAIDEIHEVK